MTLNHVTAVKKRSCIRSKFLVSGCGLLSQMLPCQVAIRKRLAFIRQAKLPRDKAISVVPFASPIHLFLI